MNLRYYYNMCLSCVSIEAISTVPTAGAYSNKEYDEPDGTPNLMILLKYTIVGNIICKLMSRSDLDCSCMRD